MTIPDIYNHKTVLPEERTPDQYTPEDLDNDAVAEYVSRYSREEKIEMLKMFDDLEVHEQMDPSKRFRLVNKHQVDFLAALASSKYKFIFQSCGNQGGKTAGLVFGMSLVAKGKLKGFPYKPTKDIGLTLILGGANHKIIKHSLLPELKKWLRADEITAKKGSSGNIDHILIHNKGKADTTIICLPYEGGAQGFISFKAHAAFLDEPCEEDILDEIGIRTLAFDGPVCIAATRTPAHAGPKFAWMKHLYKGTGNYKSYHQDNQVKIITASSYDNLVLKKEAIDKALKKFTAGGAIHRMRVMGIPDEPEGPAYPWESFKYADNGSTTISWHEMSLSELCQEVDLTQVGTYDCLGGLDYGDSAPFAALNVIHIHRTQTIAVIDEGYETRLSPYQQMRLLKAIFKHWGMKPYVTVCDDQIENPQAHRTIANDSIKRQYDEALDMIEAEDQDGWETYLYTDRSYKKDKAAGMQRITNLLSLVNPRTGKPYLRVLSKCQSLIDELSSLIWNPNPSGKAALVQGADHAESALRYLLTSNYGPQIDFTESFSEKVPHVALNR